MQCSTKLYNLKKNYNIYAKNWISLCLFFHIICLKIQTFIPAGHYFQKSFIYVKLLEYFRTVFYKSLESQNVFPPKAFLNVWINKNSREQNLICKEGLVLAKLSISVVTARLDLIWHLHFATSYKKYNSIM